MSTLALVRAPGVLRTLSFSAAARLPVSAIALLILLQVRELGHSYALGGLAAGAFTFGMAIGAPLMGRLIDRRGQPFVLHACGVVAGAALIAVAVVPADLPALLVALALLCGFAQPPITACVRVIWTRLLARGEREAALALDISFQQMGFLLGPVLLLWVAAATSPAHALALTGVVIVASTSAFALGPEARGVRASAGSGARRRRSALVHRGVQTTLALSCAVGFAVGATEIGIVAFAEHHHVGVALGAVYGAWSLGAVLGGLLWSRRVQGGDRVRQVRTLLAALGVVFLLLVLPANAWLLAGMLLIVGVVLAPLLTLLYALIGDVSPADVLTESNAWATTGIAGGIALGSAVAGAVAGAHGSSATFLLAVAAQLAAVGLLAVREQSLREHSDDEPTDGELPVAPVAAAGAP